MQYVELKKSGVIGVIIIKNPPVNALSSKVLAEIKEAFLTLENDAEVQNVVITGAGGIAFVAGFDIKEILEIASQNNIERGEITLNNIHETVNFIEASTKTPIAVIKGVCLGGGLELAMACKFRLATKDSSFGQPEINLGIMPGMGGTQRLPRLVGVKNAMEILLTGKPISADRAISIGLIDKIIDGDLIAGVKNFIASGKQSEKAKIEIDTASPKDIEGLDEGLLERIKGKSKSAVESILKAVKKGIKKPVLQGLEIEKKLFVDLVIKSEDAKEGLTAFVEKRAANFKNAVGIAPQEKTKEKTVEPGPATESKKVDEEAEEYVMLRTMMKEFCKKEIAPFVNQMEKEENILPGLVKKFGEQGLFGVCFPEKYGGSGLGKFGYAIVMEELGRVHGSTAVLYGAHIGLAVSSIYLFGTEEQKQKWLVPAIKGEKIGAFALTEAEAGSDVASLKTSAKKQGDKWIINGAKQFISNGDIADFAIVFAQTDPWGGSKTMAAFIVDTKSKGFEIDKIEKKMGIKASRTTSLILNEIEVPEENLLGKAGDGFKIAMNVLNGGRLTLGAGCVGAAKEALSLALNYATQRQQFGQPLFMLQTIQTYLAEMQTDIYVMESLVHRVAKLADAGKDTRLESAIVKLFCSEASERVIDKALQIHGGYGYMEDYPIARMYRDSRINKIFEGTNEIQKLLIAKELIKSILA